MKTISISQWVAAAVNTQGRARHSVRAVSELNNARRARSDAPYHRIIPAWCALLIAFAFTFTSSAQVNLTIGTLLPGEKITVTFDATINTPFPANTFAVSNQASLTATGVALNSDDPDTALLNDPAITPLSVAPVITSCPPDLTTNTVTGFCNRPVAFAATAIGGSTSPTITYKLGAANISSPYSFEPGTNVVTVTASNGVAPNATCTFTVIVRDLELPTMACPADIVTNTAGTCSASVFFTTASFASDACGLTNLTATPAAGSTFPLGTNVVTVVAQDLSGNSNFCTFKVIVRDLQAPTMLCPADIITNTSAACSAVVNFSTASFASDICGLTNVTATPASGSIFLLGTNVVTVVARDTSGNSNSCTFRVIVRDLQVPAMLCPADIVTNTAGSCSAVVTFSTPSFATDVCGLTNVTATPPSGSTFSLGTNVVAVAARDTSGNSNFCTFKVIVRDLQAPTMLCPADIVTNSASGCPVVVTFATASFATDVCGLTNLTATPASGSAFPAGTNVVTVVGQDTSGNSNSCTFKVIVTATNAPQPLLSIVPAGTNVVLWWTNFFGCYQLEYTTNVATPPSTNLWANYPGPFIQSGGNIYVTNPIGATNQLFRLKR